MNALLPLSCSTSGLPGVQEALSLTLRHCPLLSGMEHRTLSCALGRVLAEDAHANLTMPPCDRSAMDGYAFRHGGDHPLRLMGAVPAGAPYSHIVKAGTCVAISTGGALPEGCDTVAMHEHCSITPDGILVLVKTHGANVRRRGEDFHVAGKLIAAGTRLQARHIALLAAAGVDGVMVRRPLQTALLSVGDEMLSRTADAIRDANRPMLMALCVGRGHAVSDLGILPDCRAQLADALAQAAEHHDVIILSAGTSAGDGDHVRNALLDCGGQLLVSGVAVRPGKPICFGRVGRALVIALPGNPAAAYVTFLAMGLPLLRHLSGENAAADPWRLVRAGFAWRKKPGLREYLRAKLTRGALQPCRDNGPAMLSSLVEADGVIMLPEEQTGFQAGDDVPFARFDALETA